MTGRFSGCHFYHCNLEYLRYPRRRTNEHYFPPGGLGIATNESHPIKSVLSMFMKMMRVSELIEKIKLPRCILLAVDFRFEICLSSLVDLLINQ